MSLSVSDVAFVWVFCGIFFFVGFLIDGAVFFLVIGAGATFFTNGLGLLPTFGFATGGFVTGGGAGIVAVVDDGPLPFRPSMTMRPSWI